MAVEVPVSDQETAHALLKLAENYDGQAEDLRERAREAAREAAELRTQASNMLRTPVELIPKFAERERDAALLQRVTETVREIGPCKSSAVADHLAISQMRALAALTTLEGGGAVKRTGLKRGTLWSLTEDTTLVGTGTRPDARTLVRDAARKLGCFTFEEIRAELHYLSEVTIRTWLPKLVDDGQLTVEKVGVAKIWEYVKPKGPTLARPRQAPPEKVAVEHARLAASRGRSVRGTGRGVRSGNSLVNALLREIRSLGSDLNGNEIEIVKTSHSYTFRVDGAVVASCSRTPGASSLKGTRQELRRAGILVAE